MPNSPDAEASLVGALIGCPAAIPSALEVVQPEDLHTPRYGRILAVLSEMHQRGEAVNPTTLAAHLPTLNGSAKREVLGLEAGCPSMAASLDYARIVADHAYRRRLIAAAHELNRAARSGDRVEEAVGHLEEVTRRRLAATQAPTRLFFGGDFLFGDTDETDQPVFGSDSDVLHASGEATFVIAITGVGKSTYAQNLLLRRLGLVDSDFLGYPVTPLPPGEAILYIAADRPRQIRRSLRRMVRPDQRDELDRRLLVWKGPLPFLLNREPTRLATFVTQTESDHDVVVRDVVLDSLKDVAFELSKDEGGAAVAHAVNHVGAEGREVLVLHHQRKPEQGARKAPADISDVYGSQFLTACAGNVIYLHGEPGGHCLSLHHLKQSADRVGPLDLDYDHDTGALTVQPRPDLLDALRRAPKGMTARTACYVLYGVDEPDRNTMARGYRKLERLVKLGLAHRQKPDAGFDQAALYYPVIPQEAA